MEPQEAIEQINRLMGEVADYLHDDGFHEHMDSDELLTVVLRAHLWLDRELRLMIESPLPHPDRLRTSWDFRHRLELVAALGMIDDEMEALEYVNDLRNRLAHRFGYQISEQEQAALLRKLPATYRQSVEARIADEFPARLREALKYLVVFLVMRRRGLVNPPAARIPGSTDSPAED